METVTSRPTFDLHIESEIRAWLARATPQIPFLGEEATDEPVGEVLERARHTQSVRDLDHAHRDPIVPTRRDPGGDDRVGDEHRGRAIRRVRVGGPHFAQRQAGPREIDHNPHVRRVIGDPHRGRGQGRRLGGPTSRDRERQRHAEREHLPPAQSYQLQSLHPL
jgi:hypothetical protein